MDWSYYSRLMRDHDEAMVRDWKEEVDTLLVFVCFQYFPPNARTILISANLGRFVLRDRHSLRHRGLQTPSN